MSNPPEASIHSRSAALKILLSVLKDGQSLNSLNHLTENLDARDAGFARMLSFGVLRFYNQLQAQLKPLLKKQLKAKDSDIQLTILIALYQLVHTRVPDYAVVDAAVTQVRKSRKKWAASMVNAVLRNFIRQQEKQPTKFNSEEAEYAHPVWIIDRYKHDWPECWKEILLSNNVQAPMTIRVNRQRVNPDSYKETLQREYGLEAEKIRGVADALLLDDARDVRQLPGFEEGWFSVQDAGAQLAACILQPQAGDKILDACAAPGGKTAHMFEIQPDIVVTALDISESRLERVKENCQRLGFNAQLITADAVEVEQWWQGEPFDKILLDVPCSASGVIRRHPDIKHLRRAEDIDELVKLQREILVKNWEILKPGGRLLYATCSVFKVENEDQVAWFIDNTPTAKLVDLTEWKAPVYEAPGIRGTGSENVVCELAVAKVGLQLFPVNFVNDGFYYALLEKKRVDQ